MGIVMLNKPFFSVHLSILCTDIVPEILLFAPPKKQKTLSKNYANATRASPILHLKITLKSY